MTLGRIKRTYLVETFTGMNQIDAYSVAVGENGVVYFFDDDGELICCFAKGEWGCVLDKEKKYLIKDC